jgi:hypothetical protein
MYSGSEGKKRYNEEEKGRTERNLNEREAKSDGEVDHDRAVLLSARLCDGADRGNLVEAVVHAEGARGDGEV